MEAINFYDEIKRLAKLKNLKIESIMQEVLQSPTPEAARDFYQGMRKRNNYPRLDVAYGMAKALGVSLDYFFQSEELKNYDKYQNILPLLENMTDEELVKVEMMIKLLVQK